MKIHKLLRAGACFFASSAALTAVALEPVDYLKSCEGLNQGQLLSAVGDVIRSHTAASYDQLYVWFLDTDVRSNGHIWDMYSTKDWGTDFSKKCGNYSAVGDCINREHSFPKSWFNDATPMYTDVFHLYPTDGKVNGQRSNYPYGECSGGTKLSSSGGADALGRLGTCTFSGYSGKVFEPDDEYKGDFARTYFYMAACYNTKISSWSSDMLAGNAYPAFTTWAVNLLLKWHRQDPVSTKETDRNDAAYQHQGNRNPFIDHPELAEYIWGNKTSKAWSLSLSSAPMIVSPADGAVVNLGTTVADGQLAKTLEIKATGLTSALEIAVNGQGFSCSSSSITPVSGAVNTTVTVSFSSQSVGEHQGGLVLTSGDEVNSVVLQATVASGLPALAATNISSDAFTANWVYIGDEHPGGFYTLTVSDASGILDEYPMSVAATDTHFDVTGLQPSTTYTYSLESATLVSQDVTVTTAELLPSVQILTDIDDQVIEAQPGVPSESRELVVDAENVEENILISVDAPFQVSENSVDWGSSISLLPTQDRFYVRVNAVASGSYTSTIYVRVGDYLNDDHYVCANVGNATGVFEDFENYTADKNSGVATYNGCEYIGTNHKWYFTDAGIWASDKNSAHGGTGVVRFGKTSSSSIAMTEDVFSGVNVVTLYASQWSASEGECSVTLQYSLDKGATWTAAGSATVNTTDMHPYSFTVKQPGTVRLCLTQTSGKRMLVDDIEAASYTGATSGVIADDDGYYSWDAYVLDNGEVIVTSRKDVALSIHNAVTGITHVSAAIPAGATSFALPQGHYIVVVGDYTRRIVVK